MKQLIVFAAFALLVLPAGCVAPSGKRDRPDREWSIHAVTAGACCCGIPCPCAMGKPTLGYCEANFLVEIRDGHYKNTELNGLKLMMSWRGGEWVKYYVDPKASDDQMAAVQEVMNLVNPSFKNMKVLSVERVPITVERTETTVKYSVPDSTAEIKMIKGKNGKPILTKNHPHPLKENHVQYKSIVHRHTNREKSFDHTETNGFAGTLDVVSPK